MNSDKFDMQLNEEFLKRLREKLVQYKNPIRKKFIRKLAVDFWLLRKAQNGKMTDKERQDFLEKQLQDQKWILNHLTGLIGSKRIIREKLYQRRKKATPLSKDLEMVDKVESSWDWRAVGDEDSQNKKNYINEKIHFQGLCNSCVAFGTIAAIEANARIKENIPVNNNSSSDNMPYLSEAQLFFCGRGKFGWWIRKKCLSGKKCSYGWNIRSALIYSKNYGIVPESCCPYDYNKQQYSLCNDWKNKITKISAFGWTNKDVEMKKWLVKYGPLIADFTVYYDFIFYNGGVYSKREEKWNFVIGGHCVAVIGYDDNKAYKDFHDNDKKGAWLCKNSWSELWGEKGYFWIGYGECDIDDVMWAIKDFSTIFPPQ